MFVKYKKIMLLFLQKFQTFKITIIKNKGVIYEKENLDNI